MKVVIDIDADKVDKDEIRELAFLAAVINRLIMNYSFVKSLYIDINGKETILYEY